jgi:hypothetical protein
MIRFVGGIFDIIWGILNFIFGIITGILMKIQFVNDLFRFDRMHKNNIKAFQRMQRKNRRLNDEL